MRIVLIRGFGQLLILLCIVLLSGCGINREEIPVNPPVTSPLSRDYIGFGVITDSFTHVTADPSDNSNTIGYLRRGSVVRIIRRQSVRTASGFISWVLTDDTQYGWLKEEVMVIYENESQAKTASETMLR